MRMKETIQTKRSTSFVVGVMLLVPATAWSQTGEWTVYNRSNSGLPYNGVTALAPDADGTMWVGTGRWWAFAGGGLAKFDGQNWTVYNSANSPLPNNDHVSLSLDAGGSIWSGTEGGLSRFDGQEWTVYLTTNSGMLDNQCGAPVFDAAGNGWLGCGCLAKFDGENWTTYHTGNSGLPNNFVTDVAIDAYGNVWASTFGSGVARFDGQNWTVYNTANSALPHNDVSFLAADNAGCVWAGTYGGGLARFSSPGWTPYTKANSDLPNDWIWNLSVDPQGNVWAGTQAGLARFGGVTWTVYNTSNSGLPDNNVYCIAFDADWNVWIGTQDGGLAVFRPRPIVEFNGDGLVDIEDLWRLVESLGQDDPTADIAPPFGDGVVDRADLELLMSYWGQEVEDPTLMAHWKLDEAEGIGVLDSAGDHYGFVVGTPAWQTDAGRVGGALEFDGATCVSTGSVLNPNGGSFSVLAWIKGGGPGQVIVSQAGGADWLLADPGIGALMTDLKDLTTRRPTALQTQAVITDGNWHRVSLVWDGANRVLYIDGEEVAADTQSDLPDCEGGLYLGCGKDAAPETFFTGLIDDVRIYDRAVSP